jgi:hypothetical protein
VIKGDRVVASNSNYIDTHGTVTRLGYNLFGSPLVYVKLDESGETCFYPFELTRES